MQIGDRVSIKQKVFDPHDRERPIRDLIIRATVVGVDTSGFTVKYDNPQDGYEYRAFPLNAIPEIVQVL